MLEMLFVPFLILGTSASALTILAFNIRRNNKQLALSSNTTTVKDRYDKLKNYIDVLADDLESIENFKQDKKSIEYTLLFGKIQPTLHLIKTEAVILKDKIDIKTYNKIISTVEKYSQSDFVNSEFKTTEEKNIFYEAPELIGLYRNIQKDNNEILYIIEKSNPSNAYELLAEQEIIANRVADLINGYLEIKKDPKNVHNATVRMEDAIKALTIIDTDLDEKLKTLNEPNLHDFDVTLKLINKNKGEEQ